MAIDSADLLQFIRARRSLRRYLSRPLPTGMIERIMEAAVWAPSAHNRQPWRFVVLREQAAKDKLASAMGARLRGDLEADDVPQAVIDADVGRSYERITTAPLLILLCLTLEDMDQYPDAARSSHEHTMAVQSIAMAGQNMLLMASSLGLGACWMCAPLFCPDLVAQVLELPVGWMAQGMITLGFPAQSRSRSREAWKSRVLWR